MDDEIPDGFSFAKPATYQPIVANPPAVVPAKQAWDHVSTSVARIPSVNQGRSFFPRFDPQVASLQDASASGSGGGLPTLDSGRRGESMGEIAAGLMNVGGGGNEDQSMERINESQSNFITQTDPQSAPKRNVFADCRDVSLSSADTVVQEQVTQQQALEVEMAMQVQGNENVAQGLNGDEDSSNTPIGRDHQEPGFSQSLPVPTQGFVGDSFQSIARDPNAMDIDQEEIHGQEFDGMPYVDVNLQRLIDCDGDVGNATGAAMELVDPKENGNQAAQDNDEALDESVQDSVMDSSIVEKPGMPDVQAQDGLLQNMVAPRHTPEEEDTAVAAPSRQVPLAHPQPRHSNIQIPDPQVEVKAHRPNPAAKPISTRPSNKLVRTRTAEPQVSASAEESNTPKRVVHRSTSSSRSGRMLPPRTVSREKAPVDLDVPPVAERIILQKEQSVDNVVANERQGRSKRHVQTETPRAEQELSKSTFVPEVQRPRHQDTTSKTIRTEAHSATIVEDSKTSRKSHQRTDADPTGNARFQQKIQQSTGRTGMSAEQLAAARAAALPPVDLRSLKNAINPPFVTASKQQKEALLTNILSRSSSPSNARALKGHPRANLVRERREQAIQTPQLPPRTPQVQIPGDGSKDETMALSLVFKAKEREKEIANLKLEIQKLEQQNESLERLNAGLVEEKGEALRQNAQILLQKKAAIGKAKDLIIASQKTAAACQQDLGDLRKSYAEALKGLSLTIEDVEASREEVRSALEPIHRSIDGLNETASKRSQSGESIVLSQLRAECEKMGQTTVKLQAELEEERTVKSMQESKLEKAHQDVDELVTKNSSLIEENHKLQVSRIEFEMSAKYEMDESLASLEEKHSLERDALQSQIENLKAEKASLSQEHHRLELSLAKATTLSDTLSTQLEEQRADLDKLEARHKVEQDRFERASSELKEQNTRLREEVAKLTAGKDDATQRSEELQKRLDELAAALTAVSRECQERIRAQQEDMTAAANEAAEELQEVKEELTNAVNSLRVSESDLQRTELEKEALAEEKLQLVETLGELRKDYVESMRSRDQVVGTNVRLMTDLSQTKDANVELGKQQRELQANLAAAKEAHTLAVTELEALQQEHDELVIDHAELQKHYKGLREKATELGKRLEDGQEAHRDDVAAERRKYEALKAEQDNLMERYQENKLSDLEKAVLQLEKDKLKGQIEQIQASHNERIKKLELDLATAQTNASRWEKTAGRAAKEKSQKEGGRTLIGSDFDQSSSPHEPLRSALAGRAQETERPRTAAPLPQTPTSPLTALNTSSQKQTENQPESQGLRSFLSGGASALKRVSFQEMAGSSDEMDNDIPDTLGKIAEDDDEHEEDIEESEFLMDAASQKALPSPSSIRDFTQAATRGVATEERSARLDVPVSTSKGATGKAANATLGMTRTTRSSSSQVMTYSGVSRKRGSSVLAGNDMESFTSTQEDAIYAKRSALKKQRK